MFVHINSAMRCPLLQLSISPLLLVSGGTTLPCWSTKNRALHKLLKIFQTVSRNLSKSCSKVAKKQSKVAFCHESCSKVAGRNKSCFRSDAKICKLYNKSTISKHCCAILRQNQPCQEPIKWSPHLH